MGNAFGDYQHEEAVKSWTAAAQYGKDEAIIYRNLAFIQANHLHKLPDALANIMKAIALDPSQPRYFSEAHLYMSYAKLSPQQLSEFLTQYGEMGKDIVDIQLMKIRLNIFNGAYDEAIRLLTNMEYHIKEGASFNPHVYWFDAHLQKGILKMEDEEHAEAKTLFHRAMEFPANLEAERNGKIGIAYYYLGLNAKRWNKLDQAKSYFEKMLDYTYSQGWGAGDFPELEYYKALASIELGKDRSEAEKRFQDLIDNAAKQLMTRKGGNHLTVYVNESHSARLFLLEDELRRQKLRVTSNYMQGLGYLGLGDKTTAQSFFNKAVSIDPLAIDPMLLLNSTQ